MYDEPKERLVLRFEADSTSDGRAMGYMTYFTNTFNEKHFSIYLKNTIFFKFFFENFPRQNAAINSTYLYYFLATHIYHC